MFFFYLLFLLGISYNPFHANHNNTSWLCVIPSSSTSSPYCADCKQQDTHQLIVAGHLFSCEPYATHVLCIHCAQRALEKRRCTCCTLPYGHIKENAYELFALRFEKLQKNSGISQEDTHLARQTSPAPYLRIIIPAELPEYRELPTSHEHHAPSSIFRRRGALDNNIESARKISSPYRTEEYGTFYENQSDEEQEEGQQALHPLLAKLRKQLMQEVDSELQAQLILDFIGNNIELLPLLSTHCLAPQILQLLHEAWLIMVNSSLTPEGNERLLLWGNLIGDFPPESLEKFIMHLITLKQPNTATLLQNFFAAVSNELDAEVQETLVRLAGSNQTF